jgi:hypothetical protein
VEVKTAKKAVTASVVLLLPVKGGGIKFEVNQ